MAHRPVRNTARRPPGLSPTARKLDCRNGHGSKAHRPVRNTARRPHGPKAQADAAPRRGATAPQQLSCSPPPRPTQRRAWQIDDARQPPSPALPAAPRPAEGPTWPALPGGAQVAQRPAAYQRPSTPRSAATMPIARPPKRAPAGHAGASGPPSEGDGATSRTWELGPIGCRRGAQNTARTMGRVVKGNGAGPGRAGPPAAEVVKCVRWAQALREWEVIE